MSNQFRWLRGVLLLIIAPLSVTTCKSSTTEPPPAPNPTPTTLAKVAGDNQAGVVGSMLPTTLTVQVNDQNGNPMSAVNVTFAAAQGSVSAATVNTDANGQASVSWTLGITAGQQQVAARVTSVASITTTFTATAGAAAADAVSGTAGDGQTGLVSTALTSPLEVTVTDQYGNGIASVDVTFAVTGGGGSVNPTSAQTDAAGKAQSQWTLGPNPGANTAEATVAGVTGSPVSFSATGTLLSLSSVTDPMVEGGVATLTGTGFDATPANNTVSIGGLTGTVTQASATSLTVTVPTQSCKPANDVAVTVTVSAQTTAPVMARLNPANTLSMSTGAQVIVAQPSDLCLQFLPDATGGDEYLIGVSATAEVDGTMPFSLIAEGGAASDIQPAVHPLTAPSGAPVALTPELLGVIHQQEQQAAAESRLRQWERDHLPLRSRQSVTQRASSAAVVPTVGDMLQFKVPDITGNLCTDFTTITTVVKVVSAKGIIVTDVANPTADPLTDPELTSFGSSFDTDIFPILEANFGPSGDLDANQRVFMVLTQEVNRQPGLAGFVTSADLFTPAQCASSDQGEIFYGNVPDPANTTGSGARTKSNVVNGMLPLISHEVTHTIQFSRSVGVGPGLDRWEAEGQAELAVELVAHAVFGNAPGMDYGPSVMTGPGPTGINWYEARFIRLAYYFGWISGSTHAPNTPEACSVYGHEGASIPCSNGYFYGSGWAFFRYVNDRFGPNYTSGTGTGPTALQKDWIVRSSSGAAGIEQLLQVDFDTLFVRFAAMLYTDGRTITGLAPELQMSSWNIRQIFDTADPARSLTPTAQAYGTFNQTRQVRGGSTAYTLLTSSGSRGALAIRLRNQTDGVLAGTMKPHLWIVRTN
jgi:Bacterial Ig-like domain (group 1)/IPT/TIG domain